MALVSIFEAAQLSQSVAQESDVSRFLLVEERGRVTERGKEKGRDGESGRAFIVINFISAFL